MEVFAKRSAGVDVHKKMLMVTVLCDQSDGTQREVTKAFGTFPKELISLKDWLLEEKIELLVMESTGVYWKSVFAALEGHDMQVEVVNARHVKKVPGRKTDVQDSQWLARLARFGLLRGSFIPEKDLRELRVVSRYRSKLIGMLASEKNRLNKVLDALVPTYVTSLPNYLLTTTEINVEKLIETVKEGLYSPQLRSRFLASDLTSTFKFV